MIWKDLKSSTSDFSMLDIHSHIIYGIDDGAKSMDDSIQLLEQASKQGISHIIATPHYNDFISDDFFDKRKKHCDEINQYAQDHDIGIQIEYGCEVSFQVDWEKFDAYEECAIRGKYLLIEFSDFEIPHNVMEIVFSIRKRGYTPIVAHPERCHKLQDNLDMVKELHRMGCLFQLDAGSLKNHFGKDTMKTAKKFLKMNLYHLIGSDAHSPRNRSYNVYDNLDINEFQNYRLKDNLLIEEQPLSVSSENSIIQKIKSRFGRKS